MIVWVNQTAISHLTTHQLNGAISDNFIGIHVGRCSGAGLKYIDYEMLI